MSWGGGGVQELSSEVLQGLGDGDGGSSKGDWRQVRNWVENNEYIRPESPTKKRASVHLGQVLLLNQVR